MMVDLPISESLGRFESLTESRRGWMGFATKGRRLCAGVYRRCIRLDVYNKLSRSRQS